MLIPNLLTGQWSSHLPIISLDTKGQSFQDEPKVHGEIKVFWSQNGRQSTLDSPYIQLPVGVEYRGQSSQAKYPKKGMGLEFRNEDSTDLKTYIFNMPEASDWVMHHPYGDKSLMRNAFSYTLASEIMEYAPRVQYYELEVNQDYYGVGVWTERLEGGLGRVPIHTVDPNSEEDISGGYVLKFDKGRRDEVVWTSSVGVGEDEDEYMSILVHDPKPRDLNPAQRQYLRIYLERFDRMMKSRQYSDAVSGYSQWVDMESLVDYIILTEFSRNVDAYRISTYFYKQHDSLGGKLVFGPVWDYNLAYGNANYCQGGSVDGWAWDFNYVCEDDRNLVHFWWEKWARDSSFIVHFEERWNQLRQGPLSETSVIQRIDSLNQELGDAAGRNFERWPILGKKVWPNRFVGSSHFEEVNYLKNWMLQRLEWMDYAIENDLFYREEVRDVEDITIQPNPTYGEAIIKFKTLYPGARVSVDILNMMGGLVEHIPETIFPTTSGRISWTPPYSGAYILAFNIEGVFKEYAKVIAIE